MTTQQTPKGKVFKQGGLWHAEIMALAVSTFAAVADNVGADEARKMFNALEADGELLEHAHTTYLEKDTRERWTTVYVEGESVMNRNGFGREAGWFHHVRQMEIDGTWFEAEEYSTEARTIRVLRQYTEYAGDAHDEGTWEVIWDEETW